MGKERFQQAFEQCRLNGRKAFIGYIMAGEHGIDASVQHLKKLEALGTTVVELGVPFSDPVADGPVIQAAGTRALARGVRLQDVLSLVHTAREEGVRLPIVLMTYANPIFSYGIDAFFERCAEVGVDGLIIPDVPFEETKLFQGSATANDVAIVPLVTLTSPKERIQHITESSEGFVYAVTVTGVTGGQAKFESELFELIASTRSFSASPVCAGFGIRTAEQIRQLCRTCDGVIVGSGLIEAIGREDWAEVADWIEATKVAQ
ncbi:MAG: tryptophan synthase subunit alpha [Bacilli bacterium]